MSSVGTQPKIYPDAFERLPALAVSPPENPAQAQGINGGIMATRQKRGLPALKSPHPLRTMHLCHYIVGFVLALWGLGVPLYGAAGLPYGPAGLSSTAISWAPNRLDVFARNLDGTIYHTWNTGGPWPNWEALGGKFISPPAAVSWGPGRLDLFAVGSANGAVFHKYWNGGPSWVPSQGSWEPLGAPSGVTFLGAPAAVSWTQGRLDVFALGSDHVIYRRAAANGSTWAAWEPLGGKFRSPPAAVSWGPGRLDLFALGYANGAMFHKYWNGGAWVPSQGSWEPLPLLPGGVQFTIAEAPAAVSWAPNRLDVFALGPNGTIYHTWNTGGPWPNWEALGGRFLHTPAAVSWGSNRLDAFAVGVDTEGVFHKYWNGGPSWVPSQGSWNYLGIPSGAFYLHTPAAVSRTGWFDVFSVGANGLMYHRAGNGTTWGAWQSLGAPVGGFAGED
jgi:hypothetical protein